MERIFVRTRAEVEEAAAARKLHQLNIGVTGLGRSTGATFVASSLAFFSAASGNSVSFTQCLTPSCCDSLFYDTVAMDQRFSGRVFTDIYRLLIEGKPVRSVRNVEKKINWLLPTPWTLESETDLNPVQRARLIQCARDDVCIFDMAAEPAWNDFLPDMDRMVVVVDPRPSKLIRNSGRFQMLKKLELSGTRTHWIVNRMNSGVSKHQIRGYLKNHQLLWLPEMETAMFYADEFACRFSWENDEIRSNFLDIFTKVSQ